MSSDPASEARALEAAIATRLTVDLGAIRRNWRKLADLAAPAECAAVVKADGYGLGAARVVDALLAEGCRTFFVATVAEGEALRPLSRDALIYVLDGVLPGSAPAFARSNLRPVLSTAASVAEWLAFSHEEKPRGALHIDTGMNRLGLTPTELVSLNIDEHRPVLLLSHLACADQPEHTKNMVQRKEFEAVRHRFPELTASLANSAGILLGPAFHFDLVRPGIALYGGRAHAEGDNPTEPVVTFEARVAQIRDGAPGDTVGYGATRTLRRPTRLAIVAAGYADGFMRAAGSSDTFDGARAFVAGKSVPVMGRVSMDIIALDVTDLPEGAVAPGDWVELLGPNIGIDELAGVAGTISYEILTGIGRRATRVYTGG